jgi:hypothetical protein
VGQEVRDIRCRGERSDCSIVLEVMDWVRTEARAGIGAGGLCVYAGPHEEERATRFRGLEGQFFGGSDHSAGSRGSRGCVMERCSRRSHTSLGGGGKRSGGERNPARTTTVVMPFPAAVAWKRDDEGEKEREGEDKAERERGRQIHQRGVKNRESVWEAFRWF